MSPHLSTQRSHLWYRASVPRTPKEYIRSIIEKLLRSNTHWAPGQTEWNLRKKEMPNRRHGITDYFYIENGDIRAYISQIVATIQSHRDILSIPKPHHYSYQHSEYSLPGLASSIGHLWLRAIKTPDNKVTTISPIKEALAFGDIDRQDIASIIKQIVQTVYQDLKTINQSTGSPEKKGFLKLLACMCWEATTQSLNQKEIESIQGFYQEVMSYFWDAIPLHPSESQKNEKTR